MARRGIRIVTLGLLVGALVGCDWTEDQAGAVTGPAVVVHCDNLTPGAIGDSTTKVNCPNSLD